MGPVTTRMVQVVGNNSGGRGRLGSRTGCLLQDTPGAPAGRGLQPASTMSPLCVRSESRSAPAGRAGPLQALRLWPRSRPCEPPTARIFNLNLQGYQALAGGKCHTPVAKPVVRCPCRGGPRARRAAAPPPRLTQASAGRCPSCSARAGASAGRRARRAANQSPGRRWPSRCTRGSLPSADRALGMRPRRGHYPTGVQRRAARYH